jgi:hypothetical protein
MTEQQNQVSSAINHEEHAITLDYVEQIIEDDEEIKVEAFDLDQIEDPCFVAVHIGKRYI